MKILISPSDIIKRGLWSEYAYYVVGSDKEAEKILKEDKEFELSERDAIIIGLLKAMETDNLVFRFIDYLTYNFNVKSIKDKDKDNYLIKKKTIETLIEKFKDKFPEYWTPDIKYKNALTDMHKCIDEFEIALTKINIVKITILNISHECYSINSLKKILTPINYGFK